MCTDVVLRPEEELSFEAGVLELKENSTATRPDHSEKISASIEMNIIVHVQNKKVRASSIPR